VTTAAVVLAAGGGSRWTGEGHKLLARWRGRPVIEWALEAAASAGLDDLLVVTGAVVVPLPPGAVEVGNDHWAEGQATSLQAGVRAAAERGHDAVVVGLGDQPGVTAEAWRRVAAAPLVPPIAVATYGGRRGNPVRLAAEVWAFLPTSGDLGARIVMQTQPELVSEVACPGDPFDVDTVEDLTAWS
jgi:CTP:molybdopterin cytidylyltransferase MocA